MPEIHEMITKMKITHWENEKRAKNIKDSLEPYLDKIVEEMDQATDKRKLSDEFEATYDLEVSQKRVWLGFNCVDGYAKLTRRQINRINKLISH